MDKSYKILVCDDIQLIQESIQKMLKTGLTEQHEIIFANNGRDACIMANKYRPDLILMDIEMPEMNGIDAIKKIKQNQNLLHIPIVVMSSSRKFEKAFEVGANDFLLKPINQYELLLRIKLSIDLTLKNAEIRKQHDLLAQQSREVINQRDTILNNLYYASYIQKVVFMDKSLFEEMCSSYFIFNKPRNIVSGDFYWITKKSDLTVFAVGDCTGHGMSGALLTITAYAFLHEIINSRNHIKANEILNELRIRLINLLHQKGKDSLIDNGLDIALCVYNNKTGKLQYAGASHPLYIVKDNNYIEIIKPDKMSVGIDIDYEKSFTNNELSLSSGDTLYLFSDGYPDQFGGINGEKFKYKRFRELLLKCSSMPVEEQLTIIEDTMDCWMGKYDQVDDMLVLGLNFR